MENRNIMEIASKDVLSIGEDESITQAVEKMYQYGHRDIVVHSNRRKKFGLLSALDLIKLKQGHFDFEAKISSIVHGHVEILSVHDTLLDGLNAIRSIRAPICVIDDEEKLVGFVSYSDLMSAIDPSMMVERKMIGELFIGSQLKKTSQESSLHEVIGMLDNTIYDAVILTDEELSSVGIITTKDIIKFFSSDVNLDSKVKEYMVFPLLTVPSRTTIKDALIFINDKHFKRLIVTDEMGETIGQITQEELLTKVYTRWVDLIKQEKAELTELNKTLVKQASDYEIMLVVDKLTGIYNRGKFEHELSKEIERIKRYNSEPFSLVFFDIDNFKSVNDTYGHLVGDQVLITISQLFKGLLRAIDMIARWGGEEFVIILYNTNVDHALLGVEKLRRAIEDKHIRDVGYITCSFGVTEYIKGDSVQSILLRADNLMYEAKKQGKNRVVTSLS